ncbi:MAG: 50S ribosomal protein L25 [Bacteroidetes bacterium]|jgi:large subunit ribosomal protein L25|nr:50S ribosomal protein L25 [Bacteroidota bacterium]
MSELTITAEIRKQTGKGGNAMRARGVVPGIYYGHGLPNIAVAIPELALRPLYATAATHIVNLKLDDGTSRSCILKAIDFDPVTDRPVHFDLLGLNENEEVEIMMPVVLTGGVPSGVKEGGILQHILHRIKVSCLPKFIPESVSIDVANLGINKSIHVGELTIPNVKILEDTRSTVVAVIPPTVEKAPEVATTEAVAAPAEPEVIAKGKKPEEEGADKPAEKEKK